MYVIESADPCSGDAAALLDALSCVLVEITGSDGKASFDPGEAHGHRGCFVMARDMAGVPVGCGALRPLSESIAEVKRMFAVPGTTGVGTAILTHLEVEATKLGYAELWLETRVVNERAVAFYERRGYVRIPNFGQYAGRPEAVCFAKQLPGGRPAHG